MTIALAVWEYASAHDGCFPPSLEALISADQNGAVFLRCARVPRDPWGRPFRYELSTRFPGFRVYSLGEDSRPGGEGEDGDIDSLTLLRPTTFTRPARGR